MKKTILSIAVITAAVFTASCQKENLQGNTTSEGSASVFTATIENGASTKTTVERVTSPSVAYKTYWENTDKISINGVSYTATPDGTDATKATFAKDPDTQTDPTGTFKAYFPASMYSDSKATLPASYTYADGKYNMPMYAESTTTFLSFKNLCGVLAITVSGADFTSVSSIEVSSDQQMNGEFTATTDGVLTFANTTLTDALKRVTLTFASAKSIASDGSATFYIPVPADTHNPLTIDISNGTITKTMVTKKSGGVAVERNTVYPIAFNHNYNPDASGDYDYVVMKMGASGEKRLRWATMNFNATTVAGSLATCAGSYYAWGEIEPYYNNISWSGTTGSFSGWKSGKDSGYAWQSYCGQTSFTEWDPAPYHATIKILNAAHDVAQKEMGSNWRMPTSQEFQDLYDACGGGLDASTNPGKNTSIEKGVYWCTSYDGVAGCLFCDGINKLFFPAAGRGDYTNLSGSGSTGYYWSSTHSLEQNDHALSLYFTSGSVAPKGGNLRYHGRPVRPVSD